MDKKMVERIRGCWNAGLSLSQTYHRLHDRHGFEDKALLIQEWRQAKKKFGCGSLPFWYLKDNPRLRDRQSSQAELDQPTGSNLAGGRTYGEWKGITGPGRRLRDMLAQEREQE